MRNPQSFLGATLLSFVAATASFGQQATLTLESNAIIAAGGESNVAVLLSNPDEAANGYQFAVSHDPNVVTAVGAVPSPNFADGNPAFFEFDADPVNGDGIIVLAVLTFQPPFDAIPSGLDAEICEITYAALPAVAQGSTSQLEFSTVLQPAPMSPQASVLVAFDATTVVPNQVPGSIAIDGTTQFLRGEIDGNGGINLSDAIRLLQILFAMDPPILDCEDVGDVDDDGAIALSDVMTLLSFVIGSPSTAIPAPNPIADPCGDDPTNDTLHCTVFDADLCP